MTKTKDKMYFAVLDEEDDPDWGYGSFNLKRAVKLACHIGLQSGFIAAIAAPVKNNVADIGNGEAVKLWSVKDLIYMLNTKERSKYGCSAP